MSNEADSSPAGRSPCPSNRMISRRVGSDNALNTWFSAIIRVHPHRQSDYLDCCLIISSTGSPVNGGTGAIELTDCLGIRVHHKVATGVVTMSHPGFTFPRA